MKATNRAAFFGDFSPLQRPETRYFLDTKQISPALVREKYPQAVSAFRRTLTSPALAEAFSREADSFFRAAALGVWARDDALSDAHVDVYNAI